MTEFDLPQLITMLGMLSAWVFYLCIGDLVRKAFSKDWYRRKK